MLWRNYLTCHLLCRNQTTLPAAYRHILRQVEVFTARKECGSLFYNEACQSISDGNFKGVAISDGNGREREINKGQFYQALVDAMKARLLPTSEIELCKAAAVIDPSIWPNDYMTAEHGESEVRHLCNKFSVLFGDVKTAFREFKDNKGMASILHRLIHRVNTIPVRTAKCERGFSRMNSV